MFNESIRSVIFNVRQKKQASRKNQSSSNKLVQLATSNEPINDKDIQNENHYIGDSSFETISHPGEDEIDPSEFSSYFKGGDVDSSFEQISREENSDVKYRDLFHQIRELRIKLRIMARNPKMYKLYFLMKRLSSPMGGGSNQLPIEIPSSPTNLFKGTVKVPSRKMSIRSAVLTI